MKKGLDVLIVDDEERFLEVLSDVLRDKGYRVDIASDGTQLMSKVRKTHFDIILLDIRLPGINGVQAFIEIKDEIPHTAVIMMTAYSVEELVKEALEKGAYACLYKPFDIDRLLDIIGEVRARKLVLLVDDQLSMRETLPDVLEDKGYKVSTASNAGQTLEEVRKKHYQIILMDVRLPDMDGVELFKKVHEIDPEVAVIMITAYSIDKIVNGALERGVYAYLRKPIDIDQLVGIIEKVK